MKPEKPKPDTLLILLTIFDLLVAVALMMPALMGAIITSDATAHARLQLVLSVPVSAIVLLLVAWTLQTKGKPRPARLVAALPLLWAFVVFAMRQGG